MSQKNLLLYMVFFLQDTHQDTPVLLLALVCAYESVDEPGLLLTAIVGDKDKEGTTIEGVITAVGFNCVEVGIKDEGTFEGIVCPGIAVGVGAIF